MIRDYDSHGKKVTRINLFEGTNINDPFLTLGGPKLSCIKQYINLGGKIAYTCEKNPKVAEEAWTVAKNLMSKVSCNIVVKNKEISEFMSHYHFHNVDFGTIFLDLCTPINGELFTLLNYTFAVQQIPINLGITFQRGREQLPKETMDLIKKDRIGFLKNVINQYADCYHMKHKFLFDYEYVGVGHAAMAYIKIRLEPTKRHWIEHDNPVAKMYNLKNVLSK
jgi:hypothetical protein